MPKGGDLHNHLSGAVYAESYISQAAEDGDCFDTQALSMVEGPCSGSARPAADALANADLYNRIIDSISMRDFVPGRESAHDHFFDTFGKFGAIGHNHEGDELAEVIRRAAGQNESYLELMALTAAGAVSKLHGPAWTEDFAALQKGWMDAGMDEAVSAMKSHVDALEAGRMKLLDCASAAISPACRVEVRYILQVLRNSPREQVFAQTLAGFLLAAEDPRVVAINYVQPEDGVTSMRDYSLHMRVVSFMRQRFPPVHVSLHAGELAPGLVPPDGLRFHIREAVETAHAERIGHGVDIAYEDDSTKTLQDMASRHIAVEINLTSNDVILGVKGKDHPFDLYRHYHVPLVISTDDEGVSRTHLTEEFRRAVESYGLHYRDVKQLARNSIEYSFLPAGEKAKLLADLEHRFASFEASLP
jgi:adenosine deaminase